MINILNSSRPTSIALRFAPVCLTAIVFSASLARAQTARPDPTQDTLIRILRPKPDSTQETLIRILRAEDERRWDNELQQLMTDQDVDVRRRAALAAGRIGDEGAVPALIALLQSESHENVREMAAFALGEIESANGASALVTLLADTKQPGVVRARAVEALGKIAASLPADQENRRGELNAVILNVLKFEAGRRSAPDEQTILLGL